MGRRWKVVREAAEAMDEAEQKWRTGRFGDLGAPFMRMKWEDDDDL